jgi:hypothetical protein
MSIQAEPKNEEEDENKKKTRVMTMMAMTLSSMMSKREQSCHRNTSTSLQVKKHENKDDKKSSHVLLQVVASSHSRNNSYHRRLSCNTNRNPVVKLSCNASDASVSLIPSHSCRDNNLLPPETTNETRRSNKTSIPSSTSFPSDFFNNTFDDNSHASIDKGKGKNSIHATWNMNRDVFTIVLC